jgi:hypothetical protein
LEPKHADEFVAIEPDSGDYFLGKTLSEAMVAVRRSHPDKLAHAMRIGHKAALHFGLHVGCVIDWFGDERELEVVANEGDYPLLGVGLLQGHDLQVSYRSGQITID